MKYKIDIIYFSKKKLQIYLENDFVLEQLSSRKKFKNTYYDDWILENSAKRMIYSEIIKQLNPFKKKSLIDVGGGIHYFTNYFANNFSYTLIDPLYNFDKIKLKNFRKNQSNMNHIKSDWINYNGKKAKLMLANDLFPNIDQRIEQFIKFAKKYCETLFLIATFHNEPKSYLTKRTDANEFLWVSQFSGFLLTNILQRVGLNISYYHKNKIRRLNENLFLNNRQVILLKINFLKQL